MCPESTCPALILKMVFPLWKEITVHTWSCSNLVSLLTLGYTLQQSTPSSTGMLNCFNSFQKNTYQEHTEENK